MLTWIPGFEETLNMINLVPFGAQGVFPLVWSGVDKEAALYL